MAKDPVCGMDVDPNKAPGTSDYRGKTYYFCCNECKQKFDSNPQSFIPNDERGMDRSSNLMA